MTLKDRSSILLGGKERQKERMSEGKKERSQHIQREKETKTEI